MLQRASGISHVLVPQPYSCRACCGLWGMRSASIYGGDTPAACMDVTGEAEPQARLEAGARGEVGEGRTSLARSGIPCPNWLH